MAADSTRTRAWAMFDRIVAEAAPEGRHTNPWRARSRGGVAYEPDYDVLIRLLGVPLYLKAPTQSGVPALALDVWIAYELRRAGFEPDAVWPRATVPRVLPGAVSLLLNALPKAQQNEIRPWLTRKLPSGATASTANILGKNYLKQVDVVMSDWATGPELLISTKRMDSSFGKNAPNRVEESYGDAKNLRLRHPLAALGFVFGLRSTVLTEAPETAEWIKDLLQKLGQEDDAYHAVTLIMIEYDAPVPADTASDASADTVNDPLTAPGIIVPADSAAAVEDQATINRSEIDDALEALPRVSLRLDTVPAALQPGRFLAAMTHRVLNVTPVTMHKAARAQLREAARTE